MEESEGRDGHPMNPTPANPTAGGNLSRTFYQAALGSAIVAGIFSLVVCGFLAHAHIRTMTLELQKSEALANLRSLLLRAPDDSTAVRLREEIRLRDLQLRRDLAVRRAFSKTGGYLLLGGAVVFILAASRTAAYRRRLPMPQPESGEARRAARTAGLARASVIALGLAVGAAAVTLGIVFRIGPAGQALRALPPPTEAAELVKPFPSPEEIAKQWPRFRGPGGLGVSAYANVPTSWNGKTGDGIAWKAAVPLDGVGSPIVWGDRIFLTGASAKRREVYCYQASDGRLLWQKAVATPAGAAGPPRVSEDAGYAASTAATDGERVYAIFANGDIACFDFAGREVWSRNVGPLTNTYGHASSLATYRNLLIVQLDQGEPGKTLSVIRGLDALTGKTVWETSRPVPSSWATPILISTPRGDQLIACGNPWVIAYEPATGTELWRAKGLGGDVAPSPTFGGGLVLAACCTSKLLAILPDGRDNVTDTGVVWTADDGIPDIPSPVADDRLIWLFTSSGTLTAYRLKDGSKVYDKELDMNFYASPSLAGNRLYVTSDKGVTLILGAGEEFKELGRNELGERVEASPAFQDGRIYIRGKKNLYAIGLK